MEYSLYKHGKDDTYKYPGIISLIENYQFIL